MAKAKKIIITTVSHETLILRLGSQKRAFGLCEQCRKEVEMLTVDQAVSISGVKTSELVRRIELGEMHGIETQSGHLLICSELLPAKKEEKEMEHEKR